jgi:hypothetical protein
MPFNQFKTQVLPDVLRHDHKLQERLNAWHDALRPRETKTASGKPKKKTKRKTRERSTLYLTTQSASPYPLYQTFVNQAHFEDGELEQVLIELQRCDTLLKRGSRHPGLLLERAVMMICGLGK